MSCCPECGTSPACATEHKILIPANRDLHRSSQYRRVWACPNPLCHIEWVESYGKIVVVKRPKIVKKQNKVTRPQIVQSTIETFNHLGYICFTFQTDDGKWHGGVDPTPSDGDYTSREAAAEAAKELAKWLKEN